MNKGRSVLNQSQLLASVNVFSRIVQVFNTETMSFHSDPVTVHIANFEIFSQMNIVGHYIYISFLFALKFMTDTHCARLHYFTACATGTHCRKY